LLVSIGFPRALATAIGKKCSLILDSLLCGVLGVAT
jgi:hypothetical protein